MPKSNQKIRITRLITNTFIIGVTEKVQDHLLITKPYQVIPTADGLSMLPFDKHIVGKDIERINIPVAQVTYTEICSEELAETYNAQISPTVKAPKIITS